MTKKSDSDEIFFKSTKDIVNAAVKKIDKRVLEREDFERQRNKRLGMGYPISGIPTGISDIDKITNGLPYGITVVGARPEEGLTDFGLNVALNASKTHKVAYISPNIPEEMIMKRIICISSSITFDRVNKGDLYEQDMASLTLNAGRLKERENLTIYEKPLNPDRFVDVCHKLQEKRGTQLIVLDRFQSLFPHGNSLGESFYWKAKEISGMLHDLVSEKGLALLLLSEVKKKGGEKICSDHLRDFGVFEYDARPIILLETEGGRAACDDPDASARNVTAYVSNNLNGELTTEIPLTYLRSYGLFVSAAKVSDEDVPD